MANAGAAPRRRLPLLLNRLLIGVCLLAGAVLLGVSGLFAIVLATYGWYAHGFVTPEEMAVNRPSAGAKILDRHGTLLYEFVDDTEGIRHPVALADISPAFLAATIATEDASFFDNPGVNPHGLARAGWENLSPMIKGGETLKGTGGSSITQQLVKNLYIQQDDRATRSLDRKVREVVYAVELTKRYEKSQILEWYVNQISYGGIYTGVEAASQGYFGKPARDLTLAEASLLAGIPQSPAAFDPLNNLAAAIERRTTVLSLMSRHADIQIGADVFYTPDPAELAAALEAPLEVRQPRFDVQAPHFVLDYIKPQLEQIVGREALMRDGLVVWTTLDLGLQHKTEAILEQRITEFEKISNTHNGAAVIIEPKTGEIWTMIGSRDYFRDDIDGQVNNLMAFNSPGSTLKPFVYLDSFIKLGWSPGTTIEDSPVSYREQNGTVFSPTNPNKGYNGPTTIRNSLGNSLNVPAFKTALQLGPAQIVEFAKSVGITGLTGYYGPSVAIGGVDLRAFDLTYAYSVLANGGVMAGQDTFAPNRQDERAVEPIGILRIQDARGALRFNVDDHRVTKRVTSPEHAYMITDILSDARAQCITFGCGGLSVPGYRVAVKTGTSEPYDPKGPNRGKIGETWAFGYTPDMAVGVWAGNSDNAPIVNIFSTSISYRAMKEMLLASYAGRPGTAFERPAGLVTRQSCRTVMPAQALGPDGQPIPGQAPPQVPFGQLQPGSPWEQYFQPQPVQICTSDLALPNSAATGSSPTGSQPSNQSNNQPRGSSAPRNP